MILIDVSYPAGRFDAEDREEIASHVCSVVLAEQHAPIETISRARQMTHIGFRELVDWHTGDGRVEVDDHDGTSAPPVIASVTVPRAWQEETATHMIGVLEAAVRRVDHRHGRSRRPGSLWVLVNGVPDGSIGMDGQSSTADDVLRALVSDYQSAVAEGRAEPVPEGHLVDPICGMLVPRGPHAITIEQDGETIGFCATGCRDAYVADRAGAAR